MILFEMTKTGERKFRSMRRKKRKGFCWTKGPNKRLKSSSVEQIQDGVAENQHVLNNSEPSERK